MHWCNVACFVTFLEAAIGKCSKNKLLLKYGRQKTCAAAAFLEKLQAEIASQRFPTFKQNGYFFKQGFADIFRNMYFCVIKEIDFKKQSVVSTLKVLAKSLKTVFDEVDFTVNLHTFLLQTPPPPTPPRPPLLDTSTTALVCTFNLILNHG